MLEVFSFLIDIWIAAMLSIQSVILYKLLPEIKKIGGNTGVVKKMLGIKDD